METIVILLNADPPTGRALEQLRNKRLDLFLNTPTQVDWIIAADGAANYCLDLGITPHLVVGDQDSVTPETLKALSRDRITVLNLPDQEESDLQKALAQARGAKPERIVIMGYRGGRSDHFLALMSTVYGIRQPPLVGFLDAGEVIHLLTPGEYRFHCLPSALVTLVNFNPEETACITTGGLLYPLHEEELPTGANGISNHVRSGDFQVTVHRGRVFLFITDPDFD